MCFVEYFGEKFKRQRIVFVKKKKKINLVVVTIFHLL